MRAKPFAIWSKGWQCWIVAMAYPTLYVLGPGELVWRRVIAHETWHIWRWRSTQLRKLQEYMQRG